MPDTEIKPATRSAWPILVLAMPAFVAVWSGWVGLGELTGFGVVKLLPGIWDAAKLNTAITLPIGVEVYAAFAMSVWMTGEHGETTRKFARNSALGSLIFGAAGQVAYHLMSAAGFRSAPWWITTIVSCLPVAVFGMGALLAHLVHEDGLAAARKALEDAAEAERNQVAEEARREAEVAAEALRFREAEAARAQAEAETARAAEAAAVAALEREQLRAERLARQDGSDTRKTTRKPAAPSPRKTPETVTASTPETAPDLQRRTAVKEAFLASVGGPEEWSNRKLAAELYGVAEPSAKQVDSARVNARNWCRSAGLTRAGKDQVSEVAEVAK